MNAIKTLVLVASSCVLAACASSPPSHYYTLISPAAVRQDAPSSGEPGYAMRMQSVTVPEQVARQQIMLTEADSTQVTPLNTYLWASPLPDEIRRALADDLVRRLGVLQLPDGQAVPERLSLWNVAVNVQRFESLYGQRAVLQATWQLTPSNLKRKPVFCRATLMVDVGDGIGALVEGHRQALWQLSGLIAEGMRGGSPPSGKHAAAQCA